MIIGLGLKPATLIVTWRNESQQHWPNNVGSCFVCLDARSLRLSLYSNKIALLFCTWRHSGHVGDHEQNCLSPLGTKSHFHVNYSKHCLLFWPLGRLVIWLQSKRIRSLALHYPMIQFFKKMKYFLPKSFNCLLWTFFNDLSWLFKII